MVQCRSLTCSDYYLGGGSAPKEMASEVRELLESGILEREPLNHEDYKTGILMVLKHSSLSKLKY
jgi:hypothetical protein